MTDKVGTTAIVTGGARGIGGAIARALAPEVEHVVVADVDDRAGRALVEQLGNGSFTHCDAGDPGALERLVADWDGLDVLVNNAGIAEREAYPAGRSWADTVRMNLVGTLTAIQAALPAMRARGGGTVLNVSSVAGSCPLDRRHQGPLHAIRNDQTVRIADPIKQPTPRCGPDATALSSSHANQSTAR